MNWEQIGENEQRVRVFGGWLVKSYESVSHVDIHNCVSPVDGYDWRIAMAFVPDPDNQWQLEGESAEPEPESESYAYYKVSEFRTDYSVMHNEFRIYIIQDGDYRFMWGCLTEVDAHKLIAAVKSGVPICRGSKALGSACGTCPKCELAINS